MDYQDIEMFLSLASSRNISKTAQMLFCSQSTISHRLKALEQKLGCRLVERNKGKQTLTLTERGSAFVPIAEKWRDIYLETSSFKGSDEHIYITLGCADSYSAFIFPEFYRNISANHPQLHLTIKTCQIAEIFSGIEKSTIDLGLCSHAITSGPYLNTVLFTEPMYFLCPSESDRYGDVVDVTKLDPTRELYFNWSIEYASWHQYWFGTMIEAHTILDKASLLRDYLLGSDYWTIASASVARYLILSGGVSCRRLLQPAPNRTCYRIIGKDSPLLNGSKKFFNDEMDRFIDENIRERVENPTVETLRPYPAEKLFHVEP